MYYDLRQLEKNGEVKPMEGMDGETRYSLIAASVLPTEGNFRLIAEKLDDKDPDTAKQAAADLEEISKHIFIENMVLIKRIANEINKQEPHRVFLRVLRHQCQLAGSKRQMQAYRPCIPAAGRIVKNHTLSDAIREDALAFLQIIRDETLPDLAFAVISENDKALGDGHQTTFGIMIEDLCSTYARQDKWRRQLYELLRDNNVTVRDRAKRLLELSRRPPFIVTG